MSGDAWATVALCAGLSVLVTGATVALTHALMRALRRRPNG